MPVYDLNQYETVADRVKRFIEDYPDGRIITTNLTTEGDRQRGEWIVYTEIYLTPEDQAAGLPKATGLAFERDGTGGANKFSALENAETSSRGRCLAVIYGTEKPTREEMRKANNAFTQDPDYVWSQRIGQLKTAEQARELYKEANSRGASREIRVMIQEAGLHLAAKEEQK